MKTQVTAEKNIRKNYKNILRELYMFLGNSYAHYAVNNQLSFKILSRKRSYVRFMNEVEMRLNIYLPLIADEVQKAAKNIYKTSFLGLLNAAECYDKMAFPAINLLEEDIACALESPVHGLPISQMLADYKRFVTYDFEKQIGTGITLGDTMPAMANRIGKRADKNYKKIVLILRNELKRLWEQGCLDCASKLSDALLLENTHVLIKSWHTEKGNKNPLSKRQNHIRMDGITVRADEPFKLPKGILVPAPGLSGDAANDMNCHCFTVYDIVTMEEYQKLKNESAIK